MYIPTLYGTRMTQNENDSINSILHNGRVVDNNCCVEFSTSIYLCPDSANDLILCPR